MRLDLTPNEYAATSRDLYETAVIYQDARRRGTEDARTAHRSQAQRAREEQAAIEQLKRGG